MKLTPKGDKLLRRAVYVLVLAILNITFSLAVSNFFHLSFLGVLVASVGLPILIAEYQLTLDNW